MNHISPKNYAPQFRQHCLNTVGIPTRTAVKSLQKVGVAALFISVLSVPGVHSGFAAEEKKPVIGLVMKSLANEFFKDMQEGAIKHVAQRGDLTLLPVGMHSETDIDTQVNAVENFITKKSMQSSLRLPIRAHWLPRLLAPSRLELLSSILMWR